MANRWRNNGNSDRLYFLGLQNRCRWWLQPWNEKTLAPWKKSYDQPGQHIKKQRHYFVNKYLYSQSYGFSSSHVWMWELDHKETWALKNWCFWIVVLEKTLESPLDCKEIKSVSPEGNQSWLFIGRTAAEAEAPILWPHDVKNRLLGKDLDAGKDWRQEEKGTTEYEVVGWHHWLDGLEFEQALGVGDGQGSLAGCSLWGHRESVMIEHLNWTELYLHCLLSLHIPGGVSGKEPTCQCRRHKRCWFDPWVRTIPWRRAWQPTPVFLPGESHGQRSLVGYCP